MQVYLKSHTNIDDILEYIGNIAGACTAKSGTNDEPRAIRCLKDEHMSVFEHMTFTWYVEGISRACSHQLVRHRLASFTQESQRYVKIDTSSDEWYVIPPAIEENYDALIKFKAAMIAEARVYNELIELGIKPEDARYEMPNAAKTNIWVTMNLRELIHFYLMRTDPHAQWEIRILANFMAREIWVQYPEFHKIMDTVMAK